MFKCFYFRLAVDNFKNNAKMVLPFLCSSSLSVMIFYLVYSLSHNEGLKSLTGGEYVQMLLSLGVGVIVVFSVIFLFYTNSFLMKRRKHEFGIFNILGMEKKHIARVIFYETLISLVFSLVIGIGVGILFDKLSYMILLRMLSFDAGFGFYISKSGIGYTLILFSLIYLLIYIFSYFQIQMTKPIELIHSQQMGEKEPKSKWMFTLVGIVCLGIGYYLAVSITDPLSAFTFFFIAVVLVILGTYLLFTTGSITFLKLLKKNKKYYYKTRHFISLSNMIYRMKQNAIGLANICILSTMVLVMLSTTFSLWMSIDSIIHSRFPREVQIAMRGYDLDSSKQQLDSVLEQNEIKANDIMLYRYSSISGLLEDGILNTDTSQASLSNLGDVVSLYFIPLEDYNEATHQSMSLKEDEVFVYASGQKYNEDFLRVGDVNYQVKDTLSTFMDNQEEGSSIGNNYFVVVSDVEQVLQMQKIQESLYPDSYNVPTTMLSFDCDQDHRSQEKIASLFQTWNVNEGNSDQDFVYIYTSTKESSYHDTLSLYAGFLFLGIFLSILFIIATVLIMYYKQITEGLQDRDRFEIMANVGLEKRELKRSINSQVLTVFFLPLIVAGFHICFAFPLIDKLLRLLYFEDTKLFVTVTTICFLIFVVIYSMVYFLTSKVYYRIVR